MCRYYYYLYWQWDRNVSTPRIPMGRYRWHVEHLFNRKPCNMGVKYGHTVYEISI